MRHAALAVAAVSLAALTGCPMPPSNAARMQEAATDFNTNLRFGRTQMAVERVDSVVREAFLRRRLTWGKDVTLADYELLGAKMLDEDHAEVSIKYDWFHANEQELRVSTVRQKWETHKGNWLLEGEAIVDGDPGIFYDPSQVRTEHADAAAPRSVQFPTVRLAD
jgi:hypothetical protein